MIFVVVVDRLEMGDKPGKCAFLSKITPKKVVFSG